jgi:hypothetical protein
MCYHPPLMNMQRFAPLFMLLVILSLLAAIWAGLLRIGWVWPPLRPSLAALHGPLMVSGFLGTLIGLERAVALRRDWTYLSPLLTGLGGILLIAGFVQPAIILITFGSAVLVAVSVVIVRHEWALHTVTMGAGAVAWLVGNMIWLFGLPLYQASYWWAGFLLLVIAGERLELSRVLRLTKRTTRLFGLAAGLFGVGLLLSLVAYSAGIRLASLGVVALALWFGRYDIARRTIRRPGVTRYIALNLLMGYAWLAVSGLIGLAYGTLVAGPVYDAWLHTLFLGFAFSMIFAHALIILPAVLGVTVTFHRGFYLPPILLHISLLMRVAGDLLPQQTLRQWGGLLNAVAILLFALIIILNIVRNKVKANE